MAEINREIKDFGEYIGGAKKELWKGRNLSLDDVKTFDDIDVKNYVNKNKIWKNPDWEELANQGYDKTALYFIKLMKDSFPAKPQHFTVEDGKEYTEVLEKFRDRLMEIKTPADIKNFSNDDLLECGVLKENGAGYYKYTSTYYDTSKMDKLMRRKYDYDRLKKEAMDKGFLYTKEEIFRDGCSVIDLDGSRFRELIATQNDTKVSLGYRVDGGTRFAYSDNLSILEQAKENRFAVVVGDYKLATVCKSQEDAEKFIDTLWDKLNGKLQAKEEKEKEVETEETTSNRKKRFTIKPLEFVEHNSPFGDVENIEGQNFLDDFDIRGGEFGNWLNDKERQENMNAAHDAFRDLAIALGIDDKDIGLGNRLNIAFGARGSGVALAHYEPDREVINLTKMKGAGSLAHEFFHGLDNIIAKDNGIEKKSWQDQMATANARSEKYGICQKLPSFYKLHQAIHSTPLDDKGKDELLAIKIKELTDKLDKDIRSLVWRNENTVDNPDAYNRYINYCKSLYEKALNGEELRTFTIKGRNGKYVTDPEIIKTLKDFHKEIGEGANIERNVEYIVQQIDNAASRVNYQKEQMAKGDSTLSKDTEFYTNAKQMDTIYTKMGHGYWQSEIELAARAFACYIEDKLAEKGIRNDYLCRPTYNEEGKQDITIPHGEERKRINAAFDEVIQELKDKNILHQRDYAYEKVEEIKKDDLTYTIAIRNNEVTVANAETNQYDKEVYATPEEAFDRYNDIVDANIIRYEIDTHESIQYGENGSVDFIVMPNPELAQAIVDQTEYHGSTEHTVYELCLVKADDGDINIGYVKLAPIFEDGSLGDPFYPDAEDISLPLSTAERNMFDDFISKEMGMDDRTPVYSGDFDR